MQWLGEAWRRLAFFFRRGQFERNLAEEMDEHLRMKEKDLQEDGMAPDEARQAARRRFGNAPLLRERSRDAWGLVWLDNLLQDLRYGLRQLRRNPGFTAVGVLTLALGIGANTAIFTLIDGIMLRTLPVAKPGELYRLGNTHQCCNIGGIQPHWSIFSFPLYEQLRDHTSELSQHRPR